MASSNLQIDNGVVKDDLNCAKCKSVPNDACLVPCGCRLCRQCINDLMANGVEHCSGPSEECGGSLLSHSVTDYRANKNISKLPMKCPNNGCVHACQLANMEEHLRVCPRKSVECPFRGLGCTQDTLAAEDMSGHLQRESLDHTEILIGMINNINNEMEGSKKQIENLNQADKINKKNIEFLKNKCVSLKTKIDVLEDADEDNKRAIKVQNEREEINKKEIELLKCELEQRNVQIKSIMDEIESMKQENKECTNQMKILLAESKHEIDLARRSSIVKMIKYIDKVVTAIEDEIQSTNADIDSMKSKIKMPTDYSLTRTVLDVLVSALEKHKDPHSAGCDGDENVPEIKAKQSEVTPRGRISCRSIFQRNFRFNPQSRIVAGTGFDVTDVTDLYLRRPSLRMRGTTRGSRGRMQPASLDISVDEGQDGQW